MIYVWCLVILVTFLVLPLVIGRLIDTDDPPPPPLGPDPGPEPWEKWYGAFPADTAPLIIWSDHAAAMADLEREVARMILEAERKIGRLKP